MFADGANVYPILLGGKTIRKFVTDADQVIIDYVNAAISGGSIALPPALGNLGKALIVRNVGVPLVEAWIPDFIQQADVVGLKPITDGDSHVWRDPPRSLWGYRLMAGQTMPDIAVQSVGTAPVVIVPAVPAGKSESVCLSAAMNGGTSDLALNVILTDPVAAPGGVIIIYNEPVRYRLPGGSPVLLQNFILPEGASLSVVETTGTPPARLDVVAYNRWRFDTVAGQNMPLVINTVAPVASSLLIGPPPAGQAESFSVMACLAAGTVDQYADLFFNSVPITPMLVFQEPIRYRQPGGSPVLAMDVIITPNVALLNRVNFAGPSVTFLAFNRWRFNA